MTFPPVPVRCARVRHHAAVLLFAAFAAACGADDDLAPPSPSPSTGRYGELPVAGLDVDTASTGAARTDATGGFRHAPGETVRFSIGSLALGSAKGAPSLTTLDITPGAAAATDRQVVNRLVLLQTLDADGDLNNGIQITDTIRSGVSTRAAGVNFDQDAAAFRTSLGPLLAALEAGGAFTDLDPRARTARTAVAALEQFARATRTRHVVNTAAGALRGYEADAGTWQFLGIPYGKPPVGDLRWRPPQAAGAWTGVRDAVAWGDQAAQNPALERFGEGGMSENCLHLNVTAPKGATRLPVMVWFHGGGFTALTSNTKPFNNPLGPASQGVVQVAVNHRLGPFGYVAHPLLTGESGYGGSGNYGQMDLILALQWVQAHIAQFGGDPANVTVFGESGGGRKVLSLMASPKARGLFHKAISQSGTLIPDTRPLAAAEAVGTALAANLGVSTLSELRAKPWTDVVTASASLVPYTNVDGHYLPVTERASVEAHAHNDVPFLIVVNTADNPDPIGTVKNVLPWLTAHSAQPHRAALFSRAPAGWARAGIGAYHGAELSYVFNFPDSVVAHHQLNLVLDPATGTRYAIGDLNGNGVSGTAGDPADILASAGWDTTDSAVAARTMAMWANFARTGDPGVPGLVWPVYTPANDTYVELGADATVRTGLSAVFP